MIRCMGRIGFVAMISLFFGGAAAIAQPFTPFQISHDVQDSRFVSTDGRYVVWTSIGSQLNVLGYDVQTAQPLVLAAVGSAQPVGQVQLHLVPAGEWHVRCGYVGAKLERVGKRLVQRRER